jgi:hypothetical protein
LQPGVGNKRRSSMLTTTILYTVTNKHIEARKIVDDSDDEAPQMLVKSFS